MLFYLVFYMSLAILMTEEKCTVEKEILEKSIVEKFHFSVVWKFSQERFMRFGADDLCESREDIWKIFHICQLELRNRYCVCFREVTCVMFRWKHDNRVCLLSYGGEVVIKNIVAGSVMILLLKWSE